MRPYVNINIDDNALCMWDAFNKVLNKAFKDYKNTYISEVTFKHVGLPSRNEIRVRIVSQQAIRSKPKRIFDEFNKSQWDYRIRDDLISVIKIKNIYVYHICIEEK